MKIASLVGAIALILAIAAVPLVYPIYDPAPVGQVLDTLHLRLASDVFGAKVILSEHPGHDTDFVDSDPRERILSLYRFSYPIWKRVDEQSGTTHELLADTTWGGSTKFTGSYVGNKVSLLGEGPFRSQDDDLVIKTREVAMSGQWATGYTIVGIAGSKFQRLATVDGLWDVDASITPANNEGLASLHLHGVEQPTEPPFMRTDPKVDADIHYDGVHWVTATPGGPTFGLYESTK